jgi:hypothetical protein
MPQPLSIKGGARPLYPSRSPQPANEPSRRSGLTKSDMDAAHAAARSGRAPASHKTEAEEFRQSFRIDLGGLELLAKERNGSQFEAAHKFCALQHTLVASMVVTAADKRSMLNELGEVVNTLDALHPDAFFKVKESVASARRAVSLSESIKRLETELTTGNRENARLLIDGRSNALAGEVCDEGGPFKDYLCHELLNCWTVAEINSDPHVGEQVRKDLIENHVEVSAGAARFIFRVGHTAGFVPSASDIASFRAAEATTVTAAEAPARIHLEPARPIIPPSHEGSNTPRLQAHTVLVPGDPLLRIADQQNRLRAALAEDGQTPQARVLFKLIVKEIRQLPSASERAARREALIFELSAAGKPEWIKERLPRFDEAQIGKLVRLPGNVVQLSKDIDRFLAEDVPLDGSGLAGGLLLKNVSELAARIASEGAPGESVLSAKLMRGLGELRVTHQNLDVRAEIDNVLGSTFKQVVGTQADIPQIGPNPSVGTAGQNARP